MTDDPRALKLYIDGNCYENPGGAGAYACVARFPEAWERPDELVFQEGFHETTNQRMELSACIRAYEYVAKHGGELGMQRVIIVTDSLYVYENYQRAPAWRSNGWTNSVGRPVENSDLWKRFLSARQKTRLRIDIRWKKGKGSPILKEVDRAAKAAGRNPRKQDFGFRGGKISRSLVTGGSASMYPASGQEATIRVYRTLLIGKTGNKIVFDLFSDEAGMYVEKCFAYARPPVVAELHRQHCYRVKFNTDPRHPRIEELISEVPC